MPLSERQSRASGIPAPQPDQSLPIVEALLRPDARAAFSAGTATQAYQFLGAHPLTVDGVAGTAFAVWAPNAAQVSVIGDFNAWQPAHDPLAPCRRSGVWATFLPTVATAPATNTTSSPATTAIRSRKPTRSPSPARCHPARPPSSGISPTTGVTRCGWPSDASATRSLHPSRSTRCIWARGAGVPAINRSPTVNWPRGWPSTSRSRIHARRVLAGHGASLLWFLGLSSHGILCSDTALWHAARLYVSY